MKRGRDNDRSALALDVQSRPKFPSRILHRKIRVLEEIMDAAASSDCGSRLRQFAVCGLKISQRSVTALAWINVEYEETCPYACSNTDIRIFPGSPPLPDF